MPMTWTATMVTRLALGGVYLAGHDGGAGLVFRDEDLAQAAAGAGGQPAHVVGDLHQVARPGPSAPRGRTTRASLAVRAWNLLGAGREGHAGQRRDGCGAASRQSPAGALSPVPTAVPPRASSLQRRQGRPRSMPAPSSSMLAPAADLLREGRWARRPADGCGRILTMPGVLLLQPCRRCRRARSSGRAAAAPAAPCTPAMCRAVGKVSLELWEHVDVVVGVQQRLARHLRCRGGR